MSKPHPLNKRKLIVNLLDLTIDHLGAVTATALQRGAYIL